MELSTYVHALHDRTRTLDTWVTTDLGGEMEALRESLNGLRVKYHHLQSEVTAIRKSARILKRQATRQEEGRKEEEGCDCVKVKGGYPFMSGALLD